MKNIIKKITAAAMAFTLLGAGSAAIKSAAPKTDNTLVASAASCNHVAGGYNNQWGDWQFSSFNYTLFPAGGYYYASSANMVRYEYACCYKCGQQLYKTGKSQTKTISYFNWLIGNWD